MNFNIKDWNIINYVSFLTFCFSINSPILSISGGYIFASTIGEIAHQIVSIKSSNKFSNKHNFRYDNKTKSYTKE